jgi:excisionase family DNA binding protein
VPSVWLTPKEAMEYLKVSRSPFYRMLRDGRLTAYNLAGTDEKRFRSEDLDALLTPAPRDQTDESKGDVQE